MLGASVAATVGCQPLTLRRDHVVVEVLPYQVVFAESDISRMHAVSDVVASWSRRDATAPSADTR